MLRATIALLALTVASEAMATSLVCEGTVSENFGRSKPIKTQRIEVEGHRVTVFGWGPIEALEQNQVLSFEFKYNSRGCDQQPLGPMPGRVEPGTPSCHIASYSGTLDRVTGDADILVVRSDFRSWEELLKMPESTAYDLHCKPAKPLF
jgi:hypothetical protein